MDPPPNLYRKLALEAGTDAQTVDRALAVIAATEHAGALPVFTLAHLARSCGVSARYLRQVVGRRTDPYVAISKRKRNGTTRPLFSPEPLLMDAQRWILGNMLTACPTHSASYAYQHRRSAVMCAKRHAGARWLIKVDLHDFFDHIPEWRIYRLVQAIGYPRLLSFEVARLCTRSPFNRWPYRRGPYAQAPQGTLPQGAPTSGALANAAVYSLDVVLDKLANDNGLTYTRYSDDLVFSTAGDFSRQRAWRVIHGVDGALKPYGLERHRAKTRIVPPGGRKIVLGLLVDHDDVFLTARFKRRVETHIRATERFGLAEHARFRSFDSVLSMVNHIDGLIAYAKSVDSGFADRLLARWNAALEVNGYPFDLSA